MSSTARLEHLGLNLVYLTPGSIGGMETYARELVPALRRARPELRITAFANAAAAPELARSEWLRGSRVVRLPLGSSRVSWVLLEQLVLPPAAWRAHVQLVHGLASTAPALLPCPGVVTIQDINYHHFPDAHAGVLSKGMARLVPLAAHRSTRVIAPSRATAGDLVDVLGVDSSKIDVVPHGWGVTTGAAPTPDDDLRRRLGLGERPYVLSVSAKRPHKNLRRLLEAFARLRDGDGVSLVVPGYPSDHERELAQLAQTMGIGDRLRFCGWVDDADLEGLYAGARCFVFPSLAEGFGFPVLEAMARGVPVACSDRASLPEIAGDAALVFDATDTASIASALEKLLADGELRARLAARGPAQAEKFSWERTAALTLESYERALGRDG